MHITYLQLGFFWSVIVNVYYCALLMKEKVLNPDIYKLKSVETMEKLAFFWLLAQDIFSALELREVSSVVCFKFLLIGILESSPSFIVFVRKFYV